MRSHISAKYEIKKVKNTWKLIREGLPVFTGNTKESCERWMHICARYPFGEPTDVE
jgi:hypothetical protein